MSRLKEKINNYIIKQEGGIQVSKLARRISEQKYRVNIGLYTYGSCFNPEFNLGQTVRKLTD